MSVGKLLSESFEKIPEWSIKNDLRYFLAFNKLVPRFIQDMSPVKGYELHYQLKEGDIVIDAGAYPGDYAVYASRKVGKTGKVICFEPDYKNRVILIKNLKKEKYNNWNVLEYGLFNYRGKLNFNSNQGLHSEITEGLNTSINVIKLDTILKEMGIKKVDVIKMDIEGAEIEAIKGCKQTLKNNNVHVAIASYHVVDNKKTCYFIERYLFSLGYKVLTDYGKHLTTYGWKDMEIRK